MFKFLLLLITALFTNLAFASDSSVVEEIKSATYKTTKGRIINIEVTNDMTGLSYLTLTDAEGVAEVPKVALQKLYNVSLGTLKTETGCILIPPKSWAKIKTRYTENYCLNLSFSFGEDMHDFIYDDAHLPGWYERSQVTFTFADGFFVGRTIKRKNSQTTWSETFE